MGRGRKKLTYDQMRKTFPDQVVDVYVNLTRLQEKIDNLTPDANGCLNWTGAKHVQGYGFIGAWSIPKNNKIMHTVHRLLAKQKFNSDLSGLDVFHDCGNLRCCNVDHLQAMSTQKMLQTIWERNPQALRAAGSGWRLSGPRNQKKAYRYDINDLISLHWQTMSVDDFGAKYNMKRVLVQRLRWDMKNGRQYRWVEFYEPKTPK